jgi:hypothetical protein
MMSFGVRAGARIANQELKKKPGRPDFRNRRHIGKLREPLFGGHPDQLELTAAYQRPTCSHKIELSFLNGNLMVPAGHPSIFSSDGNACGSGQPRGVTLHRSIEPSSC